MEAIRVGCDSRYVEIRRPAFQRWCPQRGMEVEKVLEEKMEKVMFEADRGDEELRRTVFGFVVRWRL